jgi:hypothetical protein
MVVGCVDRTAQPLLLSSSPFRLLFPRTFRGGSRLPLATGGYKSQRDSQRGSWGVFVWGGWAVSGDLCSNFSRVSDFHCFGFRPFTVSVYSESAWIQQKKTNIEQGFWSVKHQSAWCRIILRFFRRILKFESFTKIWHKLTPTNGVLCTNKLHIRVSSHHSELSECLLEHDTQS